jgi:hypothetical protein
VPTNFKEIKVGCGFFASDSTELGSDGAHAGTIGCVQGERIQLKCRERDEHQFFWATILQN